MAADGGDRIKKMVRISAFAMAVMALTATSASAHQYRADGSWTIRYMTRPAAAADYNGAGYCYYGNNSSYWVDPLNIRFWQYGEGNRISDHVDSDTGWGHPDFSDFDPQQTICGDDDSAEGDYSQHRQLNFDNLANPSCNICDRFHMRIWFAPHPHSDAYSKWSAGDAHHDHWNGSGHDIDMDWEDAEIQIGSEMSWAHNFYYDYYAQNQSRIWKGYYDDGIATRIGGEHNGTYP
jgi:hypothetical protein